MKDIKITLNFRESEMKWIENNLLKYYGRTAKTKSELKRLLISFASTMIQKGLYAIDNNKEYMEVE